MSKLNREVKAYPRVMTLKRSRRPRHLRKGTKTLRYMWAIMMILPLKLSRMGCSHSMVRI
jgi:hypothetical protein